MSIRKRLEDIESEVGRSLAILNDDLKNIERDHLHQNISRPAEYRKTLEILDNVLAEFDDWPSRDPADMNVYDEDSSLEFDVFSDDHRRRQDSSDFQRVNLPASIGSQDSGDKLLSQLPLSLTRNDCPMKQHSFVVVHEDAVVMSSADEDERIQELRARFRRVRELLKRNVIKLLDVDPPSFIPPPPPQERHSPTVEDIPNLLPTDLLLRPQFGMSYSMEEDLPPGIKDIRTSTPKSDVSASSFSRKFGRLSTFGSQSELEVSHVADKVPLTSFKSLTLPNGLDRFPFYSPDSHSMRKPSEESTSKSQEDGRKTKISPFRKFSRKIKRTDGSIL